MNKTFIVKGIFIDTPSRLDLRCREGVMLIREGKCVGFFANEAEAQKCAENHHPGETSLILYDYTGKLILPGFSDLHLHAPQYSYAGIAMDVQLLEWLSKYTYPEEAKYKDLQYAKDNYRFLVQDLLHSVTTRSCIFASLHTDATIELMRQLEKTGQSAYVGKLNMNRNAPDYYCENDTAFGMSETVRWIDMCDQMDFKNVHPMITPRFTPSVTDDYMEALGKLAAERNLPMQSHLSENPDEISWVKELCPDTGYYAQTYSRYGLFGGNCKTIMAHCIYSSEEEKQLMKDNGVFIAHCPTSNENVIAGIAPAAEYLREGFCIGLGSDVAGGHSLNLFEVMKAAIQCSKIRWKYIDSTYAPLSMIECLYMATAGGGSFFGKVGIFNEDYEFDAVVIDDSSLKNNRIFTPQERVERYIYLGDGKAAAKFTTGEKIL